MPEAVHVGSGKVRDIYELDEDRLLLVASDRISTFDVVLPTDIPDKGRVLTGLSGFWFARTREIVPNHLLALRGARGARREHRPDARERARRRGALRPSRADRDRALRARGCVRRRPWHHHRGHEVRVRDRP